MKNLLNQPETNQPQPEVIKPIHQSQILPGTIKQRHLESGLTAVKFGTDRPDNGDEYQAYFDTSTGILSMWTGTAWLSVTLS